MADKNCAVKCRMWTAYSKKWGSTDPLDPVASLPVLGVKCDELRLGSSRRLFCLRHSTMSADALCFRLVRPPRSFFRPSVRPDKPCYTTKRFIPKNIANGLSSLDETYMDYTLALTDDLIGFWRWKDQSSKWQQAIKVVKAVTRCI